MGCTLPPRIAAHWLDTCVLVNRLEGLSLPGWVVCGKVRPLLHKSLRCLLGWCFMQGLRCHFISVSGKSPIKLEVTSRYDHSCLLGRKASNQTNKQTLLSRLLIDGAPLIAIHKARYYKRKDGLALGPDHLLRGWNMPQEQRQKWLENQRRHFLHQL